MECKLREIIKSLKLEWIEQNSNKIELINIFSIN